MTTALLSKRRQTLGRLCRRVHGWAGAALSVVLIVLALSGSLLVFKDDYIRAVVQEAREAADLSGRALVHVLESAEQAFGPEQLRALVFAVDGFGLHKVYLTEDRAAYIASDGTLVAQWGKNERFEDWLFDLHHYLLSGDTGRLLAGFSGLAALLLIVTGVVAVWPMRKGVRRGLKITQFTRAQMLSLHRNVGVFAALPLFILVLTGALLTFSKQSRAIFDMFGGPEPLSAAEFTPGRVDWSAALRNAEAAYPGAAPRMALWGKAGAPPSLRLKQEREWHPNGRTLVLINPQNSEVIGREDALQAGIGREAFNAVYPVHAAHIGGRLYDMIVFILGLTLSLLGMAGLAAFIKRYV